MSIATDSNGRVTVRLAFGYGEVTPGTIDDDAVDVFTRGQCHALALQLHLTTGWDLYQVGTHVSDCCPLHWAVRLPDGRFLDIEGVRESEEFYGEWGQCEVSNISEWNQVNAHCYRDARLDVAETFVRPVLDTYVPDCLSDLRPITDFGA